MKDSEIYKANMDSERFLSIMETISKGHGEDTDEFQAIVRAGWLMHFIRKKGLEHEFQKYVHEMSIPLSEDELLHLKNMDIEP